MGTYLYGLRKKYFKAVDSHFGTMPIYYFIYEMKPSLSFFNDRSANLESRIKGRLRHVWGEELADRQTPEYVTVGDVDEKTGKINPYNGGAVYRLNKGTIMWYDSEPFPGQIVGWLVKDGPKWLVTQEYQNGYNYKTMANGKSVPTYCHEYFRAIEGKRVKVAELTIQAETDEQLKELIEQHLPAFLSKRETVKILLEEI